MSKPRRVLGIDRTRRVPGLDPSPTGLGLVSRSVRRRTRGLCGRGNGSERRRICWRTKWLLRSHPLRTKTLQKDAKKARRAARQMQTQRRSGQSMGMEVDELQGTFMTGIDS